ncbi:hypothetical protein BU204_06485 [Actinophytocola xanthii]|uniref:GNAT family N-acetyltransferase n=1 Tax=Actinophytocola xanthii TaxID=1912961 RepID=A0A1Q8CV57_9PSEU|nr:hypothetical protein BU204_06485 [Actinophytocola xanthii]
MTRGWLLRQAEPDDLDTVLEILGQRVAWLRRRGSDQWSTFPRWPAKLKASISRGETWIAESREHEPVGTITVFTSGDTDFWSPDELAIPALYLAKLATLPPDAGAPDVVHGLGQLILEWTVDYAARAHLAVVRLDVWRTAHALHRWYELHGWTKVRTIELPHRKSGTLFERPASP